MLFYKNNKIFYKLMKKIKKAIDISLVNVL